MIADDYRDPIKPKDELKQQPATILPGAITFIQVFTPEDCLAGTCDCLLGACCHFPCPQCGEPAPLGTCPYCGDPNDAPT